MDPLSALSLAGTVVQFVDFGTKLLVNGTELYRSTKGSLTPNDELQLAIVDLKATVKKIEESFYATDINGLYTQEDQELKDNFEKLCRNAVSVAETLIQKLDGLTIKPDSKQNREWESFQKAIKTAWTKKDVQALFERLSVIKDAIQTRIIYSFATKVPIVLQNSPQFHILDEQTKRIVMALAESNRTNTEIISQQSKDQSNALMQILRRVEASNREENIRTRTAVLFEVRNALPEVQEARRKEQERRAEAARKAEVKRQAREKLNSQNSDSEDDFINLPTDVDPTNLPQGITADIEIMKVDKTDETNVRQSVLDSVLASLRYDSMTSRYEIVEEAFEHTFDWLWDDDTDSKPQPWDNFKDWLLSGSGIYWINGKPGSGKSTLMRYIYEDVRMKKYLTKWAQDKAERRRQAAEIAMQELDTREFGKATALTKAEERSRKKAKEYEAAKTRAVQKSKLMAKNDAVEEERNLQAQDEKMYSREYAQQKALERLQNPKVTTDQEEQDWDNWIQDAPICTATYFFWNSGTPEQKSQDGLLRAILHQIFSQHPMIASLAVPWYWAKAYSEKVANPNTNSQRPWAWTTKELLGALKAVVENIDVPVCLFIDGLDEFEGDYIMIAELFKEMVMSDSVKVCVSSRQWEEFDFSFKNFPSLKLQDLTKLDIESYVRCKFMSNELFKQFSAQETLALSLAQEIVRRADGVWLWVRIVVKSLLEGLIKKDGIDLLEKRLSDFPSELKPLYLHLFSLIEDIYLPWASQAFQLVQATRFHRQNYGHKNKTAQPLTILDLLLAIGDERELANLKKSDGRGVTSICENGESHLRTRCAGLLESWSPGRGGPGSHVQYLHRTARDFLEREEFWKTIIAHTQGTSFNTDTALLRACAYRPVIVTEARLNVVFNRYYTGVSAMIYAQAANEASNLSNTVYLDQLEASMSRTNPDVTQHWSNDFVEARLRPVSNFLTFAILFDLTAYVNEKIKNDMSLRPIVRGALARYLPYTLESLDYDRYPPRSHEMAAILLGCAAPMKGKSNEAVTAELVKHLQYASRLSPLRLDDLIERKDRLCRLRSIKVLVEANADVRVYVEYEDEKLSILKLLQTRFQEDFPTETKDLVALLEKKGATFTVSKRPVIKGRIWEIFSLR